MKIICVDNFNRDGHSDELVCENVNEFYGKRITTFLNAKFSGETSSDFYRLVEDEHKLYKFEGY